MSLFYLTKYHFHQLIKIMLCNYRNWATAYSPRTYQVPSALTVLTSLFEMGRGDSRCIRHPINLI